MNDAMQVTNGDTRYHVGKLVAEAENYCFYLCHRDGDDKDLLLQIASEPVNNGVLDRYAFILDKMARRASAVEEEFAKTKGDSKTVLNYDLGFPEVVESFICPEQDGRRVNILSFRLVDDVHKMVPISNITERNHFRVDIRTSAWILGKTLKMLTFAHSEGVTIGLLDGNNILIEPERHYVVLFDWSFAQVFTGVIPEDIQKGEVSWATKSVITVLGGDPVTGVIPDDGDKDFVAYTQYLLHLSSGAERSAKVAHQQFYELLKQLGWKGFHPFTTHKLGI